MKMTPLLLFCTMVWHHMASDEAFPQTQIANGLIHIRLYLPDTANGYYRGSRFDWSGVMPGLEYKGHTYSGQWFEKYAPTLNDAIMGPVESFDPIGYDESVPGSHFVAIGIGVLSKPGKPDRFPYTPFIYYDLVNPGQRQLSRRSDRITFTQTLDDTACSYVYTKTLRVPKGKPQLVIEHTLKNTGRRVIETNVYDHNLFLLDRQPIGPGLVLSFPFRVRSSEERGIGSLAEIRDSQIVFERPLLKKESAYAVLAGYGNLSKDYDIRLENHNTGAGMRIRGDRPLSRLVFWSCSTTACPEPYIAIKIGPGEVFTWTLNYEFYECSIDHK
jgi:hypothetical protein